MIDPSLSLFWLSLSAVVAPLVAGLIPRRLVPEIVVLLVLGMIIGPYGLELAETDQAIGLLRELGLGMLFLLAGYEIEVREITGPGGRRAVLTWIVSFAAACTAIWLLGHFTVIHAELAVAIALTSTALGTLLPILRDNRLLGTRLGATVLHHGAVGEFGPILAMAMLLGSQGAIGSLVLLGAFLLVAWLLTLFLPRFRSGSSRVLDIIRGGSETTAQTTVRLVFLLLIGLGVLALVFDFEVVLGAFAAGFVLRQVVPERSAKLEQKLDGLAFGLLIPVFFVTSGMTIDPDSVLGAPGVLIVFVALILLVRGVPVFLAARLPSRNGDPRFSPRDSLRIGLFGATGLPVIVAVTSVAVDNGTMSSRSAALLVAGGALTVLFLPMLAILLGPRSAEQEEAEPAAVPEAGTEPS